MEPSLSVNTTEGLLQVILEQEVLLIELIVTS
jgi:hypothetical protein